MPRSSPLPRFAVVLAAGKGTRMKSSRPKVLHEAGGRPLLGWVLAAARAAGCERLAVIVGHGAEAVRGAFAAESILWVEQTEQLGTGHALAQAETAVRASVAGESLLLVLSGDVPLLSSATLVALAEAAERGWGAMATATLAEPGGLGRVIARPDGTLARIVEAADASPAERAIRSVNAGLYALRAPAIFDDLRRLRADNAQGELSLTDALGLAAEDGRSIALVDLDEPAEAWGVNDRADLAKAEAWLVARKARALMGDGVTLLAPERTRVEAQVEIGADTVLHADVTLLGATRVGRGCTLHQGAWLRNTTVDDGAVVEPYSVIDGAHVGPGCRVGPFARLRPGTVLEAGARVGNFVEVKNATLGRGAKANHLAYLGDASVGERANIGAGVVTCNYDGEAKHRTTVGAGAFVGSDTMLVAPVSIGVEATTAAGSVITKDVPDGALAVERSEQRLYPGWAERRKRRTAPRRPRAEKE